jgi:3-oxoacyl-[acyl-carrier-protein] synthase II
MSSTKESARRAVITGIGPVSPIGIGALPFWESLANRQSGVQIIESLSYSASPGHAGAEVRDFTLQAARKVYLKAQRKSIKVMCREIQLGVASAALAFEDSGLVADEINHERMGVGFGANLMLSPPDVLKEACWSCVAENGRGLPKFHYEKWGQTGLPSMEPLWLLRYLPNMPGCHIGIAIDARGPNNSITLDEASGNLAVGEASRIIQRGAADIMIAGTTGTRLHPVKTMHARLWDELAQSEEPPATWCRPFDRNRTGQVVGEGACSLVLEEESHAIGRGATILGRIVGSGSSCVIDRAGKPDLRKALANAARAALRDAQIDPADVGHINAHGLGERSVDRDEARAIGDVFGAYAAEIPVTAFKSYLGNAGSGCGTLELAGSLLGLKHGVVATTLNYTTPDPDCPLNVVRDEPLPATNRTFLSVNVTRAGQASALVISAE